MYIMLIQMKCRLPHIHSLKEKRHSCRPVMEKLRRTFSMSVAETDSQDNTQSLSIGCSAVSGDPAYLRNLPDRIIHLVDDYLDGFIFDSQWDVLPWP